MYFLLINHFFRQKQQELLELETLGAFSLQSTKQPPQDDDAKDDDACESWLLIDDDDACKNWLLIGDDDACKYWLLIDDDDACKYWLLIL